MAGPPNDVPPNELWLKIVAQPRPHDVVDFPRLDAESHEPMGKVAIWVLTQLEILQAQEAAGKWVREKLKVDGGGRNDDHAYHEIYNNELAVQLLARCCRRVENLKLPFFPSAREARDALSQDEIASLYNAYLLTRVKLGPLQSELSVDEMDAWLDTLEKGGATTGLHFFSLAALIDLLKASVARTLILRTDASSRGSPHEEPTID